MSQKHKKTVLITGGGQGIGLAIAHRFALEGSNIVIASKENENQIQEAIESIVALGGKVLACHVDVCNVIELEELVEKTLQNFGSLDILVNNTSAPCFNDTFHTSKEQFDLLISTSVRAAFFLSKICFPYLKKSSNSHIINISPPLNIEEQWLKDHLTFSIGKFGMSLCTMGMAAEFKEAKIAVNSLWPGTNIATERLKNYLSEEVYAGSRLPTIMADAAFELSKKTFEQATGKFFIDEDLLRDIGVTDFNKYAVDAQKPLVQTLFIPLKKGMIPISKDLFR